MGYIAGDELSRTTYKYVLDEPMQLGDSVTPLIDLSVRNGLLIPNIGGTALVPLRLEIEPGQTLPMYTAASSAGTDKVTTVDMHFYRYIVATSYDSMEAGNRKSSEALLAVERATEAVFDLIQNLAQVMHTQDWNGQSDAAPMLTLRNAFPFSTSFNFFGITHTQAPAFRHMFADTTAASALFGAGYKTTDFSDPDTGMLKTIRMAKQYATKFGANKFICLCTKEMYDHLYNYIEDQQALKAENMSAPNWMPNKAEQQGLRVGQIGYEVLNYLGITFIFDPFIDATYYDCIMFPLEVKGKKNLHWYFNIDTKNRENRASTSNGIQAFFMNEWTQNGNSFMMEMIVATRSQILLLHHPSVFVGKYDHTY